MLRAQYTGSTNRNLATIRKHLTNRKLGSEISASLYSDGSVRVIAFGSEKHLDLGKFKTAAQAIVKDAGVSVKEILYRSEKYGWLGGYLTYKRTAIISFEQEAK